MNGHGSIEWKLFKASDAWHAIVIRQFETGYLGKGRIQISKVLKDKIFLLSHFVR